MDKNHNEHAYNTNLKHGVCGADNKKAKLTENEVQEIRKIYKFRDKNFNAYKLAEKFKVSNFAIYQIIHGKSWRENGIQNKGI